MGPKTMVQGNVCVGDVILWRGMEATVLKIKLDGPDWLEVVTDKGSAYARRKA